MDKDFEARYHQLEGSHWWFLARRDMLRRLLKDVKPNARIADIGSSGGVLIKFLQERGFTNVFGIDNSFDAALACQQKGIDWTCVMDSEFPAFRDATFDVVIASDVLEHMQKDGEAIAAWQRILKPKGRLIIFVPAFPILWSSHDEVNHHYRRYTKRSLQTLLEKAGYDIIRCSYWNCVLFLPVFLWRMFEKMRPPTKKKAAGQLFALPPPINWILYKWLQGENFLLTKVPPPWGVSLLAVATRT